MQVANREHPFCVFPPKIFAFPSCRLFSVLSNVSKVSSSLRDLAIDAFFLSHADRYLPSLCPPPPFPLRNSTPLNTPRSPPPTGRNTFVFRFGLPPSDSSPLCRESLRLCNGLTRSARLADPQTPPDLTPSRSGNTPLPPRSPQRLTLPASVNSTMSPIFTPAFFHFFPLMEGGSFFLPQPCSVPP